MPTQRYSLILCTLVALSLLSACAPALQESAQTESALPERADEQPILTPTDTPVTTSATQAPEAEPEAESTEAESTEAESTGAEALLQPTEAPATEVPDWTQVASVEGEFYILGNPAAPVRLVDFSDFM